ncbi:DddA-like double-stranded DNA deaminase toxin [Crossiella sp. CA198]|uniref:DddA-like double-stranded DNA deaminase toxin n=1 Tax=Crossiella sp. CA198 TaxID=3455607 RepID=UPI003F8D4F51
MTTETDVADVLRAALGRLPVPAVQGCITELDDLRGQLGRAADGSASTAGAEAAGLLARLDGLLNDALRNAGMAAREVENWAAAKAPTAAPPTKPAAGEQPSRPTPTADPVAKWARDPRPPAEVMRDVLTALPERPNSDGLTRGLWINPSERTGRQEVSGQADQAEAVAVLKKNGLMPPSGSLSVTAHVETKVVAKMHESPETRDVHLAINNADGPCKGPRSCDRIAPILLHPGQSLTVYWRTGDTIKTKTYTGREPK